MAGNNTNLRTLFVRNLPLNCDNAKLEEFFGEIGPLKQAFVVNNKGTQQCRGIGYVTFATSEDAKRALKDLKSFGGKRLQLSLAKKKLSQKEKVESKSSTKKENHLQFNTDRRTRKEKKSRLIVRNLSFKCDEDTLKEVFEKAGELVEITIPKKPDGKMKGFGIVQFKNVVQAAKAVGTLNGVNIKGRPIAVDWALPKLRYERESGKNDEVTSEEESDIHSDQNSDSGDKVTKSTPKQSNEDNDLSSPDEGKLSENEDMEQHDTSEDDVSEDDTSEDDIDDEDTDREHDEEAKESEMDEDNEFDDLKPETLDDKKTGKTPPTSRPVDVTEGHTLFIRNVPFDADESSLRNVLKRFGSMQYCKLVIDPQTEYSKGTAFVKFKKLECAEACLKAAQDPIKVREQLRMEGRELLVSRAVDRGMAQSFNERKAREKVDKRNLWLASEGLLRAGMPAAKGLSDQELKRRQRIEAVKRQKLKDVNVFISPTRLCVHNMPRNIDEKRLRMLMLGVLPDRSAKIDECRVMRDLRNVNADGVPRSLGYAFVNFTQHAHALAALRAANNNPSFWGKEKRPIIEFSLENKLKLLSRQRRVERVKAKQTNSSSAPKRKLEISHPAPVPKEDGRPARKGLPKLKTRGRWRDAERQEQARQRKHKERVQRKKLLLRAARRDDDDEPRQQRKGRKKSRRENKDSFDKLVDSYKQKLFGSTTDVQSKKWFDS